MTEAERQLVMVSRDLLKFGRHRDGCDRLNEGALEDEQHECCSCGWCKAAGSARMNLAFPGASGA